MNLYQKADISTQILSQANRDIYPLGQIVHGTPIEFRHQAGNNQYVALSESTLCVVVRIVNADGTKIARNVPIAMVNNGLHAMFQNIEVYLNTTKVTQPNNLYPYIAYLCQLTSFEPSVLETLKRSEGYFQDTHKELEKAVAYDATNKTGNKGWTKRRDRFAESAEVQLEGRPFIPIFLQDQLIPGSVPITIRLHPSPDAFVLHRGAASNEAYKFQIVSAKFRIHEKTVSPTLQAEHMKALEKEPFRYKYTDMVPKTFVVPRGGSDFFAHQIFEGYLPHRLTTVLLKSTDMNGDYSTNPFYFRHANARSIQVESNGSLIPSQAIETNFTKVPQEVTFAYMQQMRELGIAFGNSAPAVDEEQWANGFTFYSFNIMPTIDDDPDVKAPSKTGAITVNCNFRTATDDTMTVLMVAEYPNRIMSMDAYRQVSA